MTTYSHTINGRAQSATHLIEGPIRWVAEQIKWVYDEFPSLGYGTRTKTIEHDESEDWTVVEIWRSKGCE